MMFHGIEVPSNIRHDNTLARPLRDYGPKDRVDVVITNPPFGGMEEDGIENNFTFSPRDNIAQLSVLPECEHVLDVLYKSICAAVMG
jgi:type I restriction-modification system DNA methylase subunit